MFAAANRQALALAEQRLGELPGRACGVRAGGAARRHVDASGKTRARGPCWRAGRARREGEAARQRVVRRADALGWFLTENGRRARFLVDTDDWRPAWRRRVTAALVGLGPRPGVGRRPEAFEARPLWPDPAAASRALPAARLRGGLGRSSCWSPRATRLPSPASGGGRSLGRGAGGGGWAAAAPFVLVPVAGVRAGRRAGGARRRRPIAARRRARGATGAATREAARGRGLAAGALDLARRSRWRWPRSSPRLRVATRQWSAAPMFFVSVRGDLDEPVVLREVRRLADDLRAQPGVANAWSVADLFTGGHVRGGGGEPHPRRLRTRCAAFWCRRAPIRRCGSSCRAITARRLSACASTTIRPSITWPSSRTPSATSSASCGDALARVDLSRRVDLAGDARWSARGCWPTTRASGCCGSATAPGGRSIAAEALSVERVARQAAHDPGGRPAAARRRRSRTRCATSSRTTPCRCRPPRSSGWSRRQCAGGRRHARRRAGGRWRRVYGARLPDADPAHDRRQPRPPGRRRATAARPPRSISRRCSTARISPPRACWPTRCAARPLEAMGPVVGIPVAADNPTAFKLDAVADRRRAQRSGAVRGLEPGACGRG